MTIHLKESQKIIISSSKIAYKLMKDIFAKRDDIDRENAWVISLNNSNKVLDVELISMGTQSRTLVDPKEVFL